jgi:hypothetical protein
MRLAIAAAPNRRPLGLFKKADQLVEQAGVYATHPDSDPSGSAKAVYSGVPDA